MNGTIKIASSTDVADDDYSRYSLFTRPLPLFPLSATNVARRRRNNPTGNLEKRGGEEAKGGNGVPSVRA